MGAPVADIILPKGTKVFVEDKQAPDTWIKCTDPLTIPAIGDAGQSVDVTSLEDVAPKGKGTSADSPPDFELTFNHLQNDPGQKELITSAKAYEARKIRIDIPGATKFLEFELALREWAIQPLERSSSMKLAIAGSKNGLVAETDRT